MGVFLSLGVSTGQPGLSFQKTKGEPSQDTVEEKLRAYGYTRSDSNMAMLGIPSCDQARMIIQAN